MSKIKKTVSALLDGYYYPIFVAVIVLIGHLFSCEFFALSLIFVSVFLGFLLCDTLKFLISPFLMALFTVSQKSVLAGTFYSSPFKIFIIICAVTFVCFAVAHFVIYRKKIVVSEFLKSKLFLGYVLLAAAFLLNGLFFFEGFTPGNITYALALIGTLCASFALFAVNLDFTNELKRYFLYVLYVASMVIVVEFFAFFAGQIRIENGEIVKESVIIGWGICNNVGAMMAMLIPIHFYFAAYKKRGYIFYATGVLSYIAVALSLSRASLLAATFLICACAVAVCFIGPNKKQNRIITASLAFVGILGLILLWGKISKVFGDYLSRGFDNNGRFDIWRHGLNEFVRHPIFGAGFYSGYPTEYQYVPFLPYRYHNTIIQLLATCGLFGFLSYAFHRFQTVKLFLSKKSGVSLFLALCLSGLLIASLLDNHMFNLYPCIYYSLILLIFEKTEANVPTE